MILICNKESNVICRTSCPIFDFCDKRNAELKKQQIAKSVKVPLTQPKNPNFMPSQDGRSKIANLISNKKQ